MDIIVASILGLAFLVSFYYNLFRETEWSKSISKLIDPPDKNSEDS